MNTRLVIFAVVTTLLSGAAQAQSYGPSDPARADTTDSNSRPSARTIHHPQAARSHRYEKRSYGWSGRGFDAYAAGRPSPPVNMAEAVATTTSPGGTGSPVSAGSWVGSSDRADPSGPFVSGPYGEGEFAPRR